MDWKVQFESQILALCNALWQTVILYFPKMQEFPLSNLVAVGLSGILKAKQKLGVTFNFDKILII